MFFLAFEDFGEQITTDKIAHAFAMRDCLFQHRQRFMFEGQEYHWYASEEERLGLCYWIARQFRRQVYVVR